MHHFDISFPTCQVRVVRFYVSCLLLPRPPPPRLLLVLLVLLVLSSLSSSSSSSNCDPRSTVFSAGPQPRPSTPSVPCRTSTTTSHAQCSLPDLNHDQPRPVFPATRKKQNQNRKENQSKTNQNQRNQKNTTNKKGRVIS